MLRMCRSRLLCNPSSEPCSQLSSEEGGLPSGGRHRGLQSALLDQRLVLAYAVAAVALGVIDGVVGPVDQRRRRNRPAFDRREADARGDATHAGKLVGLDRSAEALQPDAPVLVARDPEDDDELLAAEAIEQVAGAEGLAHEAREMDQDLVAVQVPEAVVDLLEIVDVGHGDEAPARRRRSVRQQLADLRIED